MPALFALGDKVIANATMSYFLAFGSFAMLLFVDFTGSLADRLRAQFALGVASAVLICLGTLAEQSTVVAVIATGIVGVVVLFAGVVSSVLASATTSLVLAFILPVTLPGPVSEIPDRVAGWGLAAAVSLVAVTLLWPAPTRNPIRARALDACRALAERLRAQVAYIRSDHGPAAEAQRDVAIAHTEAATQALAQLFFATPYRPTGLSTDARAVVRLVDELGWLGEIIARAKPSPLPGRPDHAVCDVKLAAAEVLERSADLLGSPQDPPAPLQQAETVLHRALDDLERATTSELPGPVPGPAGAGTPSARELVSALDPSFRAQEISFLVGQIARNVEYAAAAEQRRTVDRILGRQPAGFTGTLSSAGERARAFARLNSAWLHNSLRGGAALAAAVLIADLLSVQHAFWVVFGTLAVLRTNAFSTGQNGLRAVAGTTLGFIIGGVIVYLVGTATTVLWILLPVAVLIAGVAPVALSFTAGQAAFTLTLLLLFNLLAPVGWTIGILRVEDVAIGGGVSLLVGLLFWPRGAARALGSGLSEAYEAGIRYLSASVSYGLGRCDGAVPAAAPPHAEAAEAAGAARRLDDIFRGYLSDRGTKLVPLADVTSLVTGVAGVRLAADAVVELWNGAGPAQGDRAAARQVLADASARMSGWFDHFAAGLVGAEALPEALDRDQVADARLIDAVAHDLGDGDGHATATGVRVIWTGDHLDAVRRLQESLVEPARAAVAQHALVP